MKSSHYHIPREPTSFQTVYVIFINNSMSPHAKLYRAYARCFYYVQFHQAFLNLASFFFLCFAWFCFTAGSFIFKYLFYLNPRIIISVINIGALFMDKICRYKVIEKIKTYLTLSRILRVAWQCVDKFDMHLLKQA